MKFSSKSWGRRFEFRPTPSTGVVESTTSILVVDFLIPRKVVAPVEGIGLSPILPSKNPQCRGFLFHVEFETRRILGELIFVSFPIAKVSSNPQF
jgi:hypothetical protein